MNGLRSETGTSASPPPPTVRWGRRRPLAAIELTWVLAQLAAGVPLAQCAVQLRVTRTHLARCLRDAAWRCYCAGQGVGDVPLPE